MISCPSFMPPADPDNDICEKTGSGAESGEINRKKVLGTKRR